MDNPSLDIFDLVHIFYKSRKMIALIVIVVAIAAVIYSLLATQYFKSRASFYPVGKGSSGLPIDIPGLSGITSSLLGGEDTQQAEGYIEVMKSRIFSEDVIRKFDLIQYFKLKNPDPLHNMDNALKYLAKDVVSFSYESGTGLLIITASTKSKQLSLDIVNFYLIKIDEYNRHQKITQGKLNRQFLEQRVNETKASLDSLIIVNQKFQEGSKAINLESQAKTLVDAYGALVAESMKLDIELKLARANYGSSSPVIANLELRRTELDKQIKDLEHSGNTPEYLINIGKIPGVSAQYARIQMNI
ncbi:MAG: Wzz/FepE/Etk N-terminal domain-containing protein, partial [Candidatus Cloacimonetes bacterium]|nr:Wzz/FepE/Etk N-terminal domain-containing protein [Candidatus Cloacimonadota bacterium]